MDKDKIEEVVEEVVEDEENMTSDEIFVNNLDKWIPSFDSTGAIIAIERNKCPLDRDLISLFKSDELEPEMKIMILTEALETIEKIENFIGDLS